MKKTVPLRGKFFNRTLRNFLPARERPVGYFPLPAIILAHLFVLAIILFFPKGEPVWNNITDSFNVQRPVYVPSYRIDRQVNHNVLERFDLTATAIANAENPVGLLRHFFTDFPNDLQSISREELSSYLTQTRLLLSDILREGYLIQPVSSQGRKIGIVIIGNRRIPLESMLSPDNLDDYIRDYLSHYNSSSVVLMSHMAKLFIEENLIYTYDEQIKINKVANQFILQDLLAAFIYLSGCTLLIVTIFRHSWKMHQYRTTRLRFYIAFGLSLLFILGCAFLITTPLWPNVPSVMYLPIGFYAIFFTWIYNRHTATLLSLLMCMILLLMLRFDAMSGIYLIGSTLFAIQLAAGNETRTTLLRSSFFQALAQCLLYLIFALLHPEIYQGWQPFATAAGMAVGSTILAIGIIPAFENIMNTATHYRLLELTSLNAPAMRRMQSVAPGTYNHSLHVANLAERACEAIGANGLLARVGSYYHDIGKIENPEFFVENQSGVNRHDEMKPALSATVIRNHVKNGVEIARGLRLPPEVIAIIEEHHGKGLISYFYNKAVNEGYESLVMADYTYPGPWPQSREAAVVSIADGVEAASHTLKKPTAQKIESMVNSIIGHKIAEGALQNCPLTTSDLSVIKAVFVQNLTGQYHSRIEYPDQKSEDL